MTYSIPKSLSSTHNGHNPTLAEYHFIPRKYLIMLKFYESVRY